MHDGRDVPVQESRLGDAQAFAGPLHCFHDPAVDGFEPEPRLATRAHGPQPPPTAREEPRGRASEDPGGDNAERDPGGRGEDSTSRTMLQVSRGLRGSRSPGKVQGKGAHQEVAGKALPGAR